MIKEFAFVGVPVTDIPRARKFYEGVLGLKTTEVSEKNVEYAVGEGTLMIANYGEQWKPVTGGTLAAFEVEDVDGLTETVKASGATIQLDPMIRRSAGSAWCSTRTAIA